MTSERWTTRRLSPRGGGAREGWWGVSDAANLFLDQLAVWRELSFNGCEWFPRYMDYQSFPSWARETLEAHGSDSGRRYALKHSSQPPLMTRFGMRRNASCSPKAGSMAT
jgi:hypothetical protein